MTGITDGKNEELMFIGDHGILEEITCVLRSKWQQPCENLREEYHKVEGMVSIKAQGL